MLPQHPLEEPHPLEQVPVGQEVLGHVTPAARTEASCFDRVLEQMGDEPAEALEVARLVEEARLAVHDLVDDSPHRARDDGPGLPHRLGDRQPEPLRQALLDDDSCVPLQRVHDERVLLEVVHRDRREVDARPVRLRKALPRGHRPIPHLNRFRVVVDSFDGRACEEEMCPCGAADALHEAGEHADHVLHRIPPRNLHDQGNVRRRRSTFAYDPSRPRALPAPGAFGRDELGAAEQLQHLLGLERDVLRREGVDRRGDDFDRTPLGPRGNEAGMREDERVGWLDVAADELPGALRPPVGALDAYVAAPDDPSVQFEQGRNEACRLRVVDDDHVAGPNRMPEGRQVLGQGALVRLAGATVQLEPVAGPAVEAVVDPLRDGEELRVAARDEPLGVDAGMADVSEQGAQQLRDASASRGRVHDDQAPSLEELAGSGGCRLEERHPILAHERCQAPGVERCKRHYSRIVIRHRRLLAAIGKRADSR